MTAIKKWAASPPATATENETPEDHLETTFVHWVRIGNPVIFNAKTTDTSASEVSVTGTPAIAPPPEQVYPHLFDPDGAAGEALSHVEGALRDARDALSAFGNSDLEAVASRLAQVAAAMQAAQRLANFNEDFAAVVSFIRRAALGAEAADISRGMLNALIYVLGALKRTPALDLEEAGNLAEALAEAGWNGEHPTVEALMAALFPDESADLIIDRDLEAAKQT